MNGNGFPSFPGAYGSNQPVGPEAQPPTPPETEQPLYDTSTSSPGETTVGAEESLIRVLVERGRRPRAEVQLTDEVEGEIAHRVIRDFQDAVGGLKEFRDKHIDFWKTWRGVPDEDFEGPLGELSSNIVVPVTSSDIETMKARLYKALTGGNYIAQFATLDDSIKEADLRELNDWFKYELDDIIDIKSVIETVLHECLVDGFSLAVPSYDHVERTIETSKDFPIQDGVPLEDQLYSALVAIFEDEQPTFRIVGEGQFEVEFVSQETGKGLAQVEFSLNEDMELVATIERPEVVFDGVKIDTISFEHLVIVNSDPDLEKLPFFGTRLWVSVKDFYDGVESDLYRDFSESDMERIVSTATEKQGDVVGMALTEEQDREEGTQSKGSSGWDLSRRWIEVYRWEGDLDIRGPKDGLRTWTVRKTKGYAIWVLPQSQRVLRIEPLERLNKDGGRTPVKFDYIVQPGRFFSIGLPEWLQHVQAELTAIHRQRLDAGLLANNPFFFYSPAAGMQKTILDLRPGKGYPVKDPSSVYFPTMNLQFPWSFNEEAGVMRNARELSGVGEPALGSFTSKRTSASEFMGTAAAIDLRTELLVERLLRSLRKLLWRVFSLYQQYARDGRVFQVTGLGGEKIVKRLRRDLLGGRLSLHLTGNIQQISAEYERSTATTMLGLFMNDLLVNMGIVKADTIYSALTKVVRASGYTGVPLHEPDSPGESPAPNIEHKMMLNGEIVQPHPNENFNEHLTEHMQLASSPQFEDYFPTEEARQLLAQHIQQTQTMQQAVQMVRQEQAQMALGMKDKMSQMGVRPGLPGGQQVGDNAEPATQEEGMPMGQQEGGQPQ